MTDARRFAGRYGPQSALAAAFLVVVLLAPSHAPDRSAQFDQYATNNAAEGGPSAPGAGPGTSGDASGSTTVPGAAGGTAGPGGAGSGGTGTGGSGGSGGASAGEAAGPSDCSRQALLGAGFPCRPAFSGTNAGPTYAGVTAEAVNVVIYLPYVDPTLGGIGAGAGLVIPYGEVRSIMLTYSEWAQETFEAYGRKVNVQFFETQASVLDPSAARAEAVQIIQQYDPFLMVGVQETNAIDEFARRGVVCLCGNGLPGSFLRARAPFVYQQTIDGDTNNQLIADALGALGPGRTAAYAGPNIQGRQQVIGIVYPNFPVYAELGQDLVNRLKGVGIAPAVALGYAADVNTATQQATTTAQALKSAGVTTVVCACEVAFPLFLMSAATGQDYYPEWFQTGYPGFDIDVAGQLYDTKQTAHLFGISTFVDIPSPDQAPYVAVYRDRAGGTPNVGMAGWFMQIVDTFLAIESAGPTLHPGTLQAGMFAMQRSSTGPYDATVSYSANDYGGIDDARYVWWDGNATSPSNGKRGRYQVLDGGRRYPVGGFPSGDPGFFGGGS